MHVGHVRHEKGPASCATLCPVRNQESRPLSAGCCYSYFRVSPREMIRRLPETEAGRIPLGIIQHGETGMREYSVHNHHSILCLLFFSPGARAVTSRKGGSSLQQRDDQGLRQMPPHAALGARAVDRGVSRLRRGKPDPSNAPLTQVASGREERTCLSSAPLPSRIMLYHRATAADEVSRRVLARWSRGRESEPGS